jgi:hypothetical protein
MVWLSIFLGIEVYLTLGALSVFTMEVYYIICGAKDPLPTIRQAVLAILTWPIFIYWLAVYDEEK